MDKRILIGTVKKEKAEIMTNLQFQYAASFESLNVDVGEYPIYALEEDIKTIDGKATVMDARIGYEGIVTAGNVGGKPGDRTSYNLWIRGYMLAELFVQGHRFKKWWEHFELRPEWDIMIHDYINLEGKRRFMFEIVLKDGAEFTYM